MNIDTAPILIAGGGAVLGFYYGNLEKDTWMTIANCTLSMIIGELSARTFCFVKSRCERSNLKDKYSIGDFFSKSEKAAIMAIAPLSAAYLLSYSNSSSKLIIPFSAIHFLYRGYTCPPPIVVKEQYGRKLNGIYYGPAMAYNYFYGYFKIILFPPQGISFQEKVLHYIEANTSDTGSGSKINVPDKRLQILIPLSGECARNLCEKGEKWITTAKTPAEVVTDRGGVKARKYHNTMYRIKRPDSNDNPVYVVAEYATPIITYSEACIYSGELDLQQFKAENSRSFYETLKRLVELESSTKDNVNLILYDDIDASGKSVNIAQFLLDVVSGNNQ